jgi:hypothetical protein
MKTTVELPDSLLSAAKKLAIDQGCTLKSVLEVALQREIARHAQAQAWEPDYSLCFSGTGMSEEAKNMSWSEIREEAMDRSS